MDSFFPGLCVCLGAACASASVAQYQRFFLGDTLHNSASVALGPMTSSLANVSTGDRSAYQRTLQPQQVSPQLNRLYATWV